MNISKRCALTLMLCLALIGCTAPHANDGNILTEMEPIFEAPAVLEPISRSPSEECETISAGADDGIGGTGCAVD